MDKREFDDDIIYIYIYRRDKNTQTPDTQMLTISEQALTIPKPEDNVAHTSWPKRLAKRVMLKLTGWIWRPAIEELNRRTEIAIRQLQQAEECVHSLQADEHEFADMAAQRLKILEAKVSAAVEDIAAEKERFEAADKRLDELSCLLDTVSAADSKWDERLTDLEEQGAQTHEKLALQDVRLDRYAADMGAVARQVMLAKWKIIDHLLPETEKPDDILTCGICGSSHPRSAYKTLETDCIFYGGHLVRYECPDCGAIFGPSKFTAQGQQGIDEDYQVHYLGFHEGDSVDKEERAFFLLKPQKNKVYLNYGCGRWSHTLQQLREMGYNVYGYEPYAPELDNPYLITNWNDLEKMRFDGIFSTNVLEHFVNPIQELTAMKKLLLGPSGVMAHCTPCYIYKYEVTRFHTFFFTGRSAEIMAEKAGLEIVEICNDVEKNDFICYLYKPLKYDDLLPQMSTTGKAAIGQNAARMRSGGIVYGPYFNMAKGDYQVRVLSHGVGLTLTVTADSGRRHFMEKELSDGESIVAFSLPEDAKEVEFVVSDSASGYIEGMWLERPETETVKIPGADNGEYTAEEESC